MKVKELIELLNTMPEDAEVATTTMPGKGMFAGIHGAVQYTSHDSFGDFKMVILENGTYPTILPDKETMIELNGKTYKEGEDARFSGCEFCDVRIKDYPFYKQMCLNKEERPCGRMRYLKISDNPGPN